MRTSLQAAYVTFLAALELGGATAAGISTIQSIISRVMPQTFQETLYYAYGLQLGPAGGWADLRPGMVLRVVINGYLNPSSVAPDFLNGYVGGATLDYDVASYFNATGWLTGFDTFLAQLVASETMQVSPPATVPPGQGTPQTESGIAEAADLFFPKFCAQFYRLFFPSALTGPTTVGNVFPARNFALAAASSYTNLTGTVNYPTGNNVLAYFRGRAILKLCIRVSVNGIELVVPVGTTVANALERYGTKPPSTAIQLSRIVLRRMLGPAVFNPAATHPAGQSFRVRLDWGALALYGGGQDALTLPLLHGDQLTISD